MQIKLPFIPSTMAESPILVGIALAAAALFLTLHFVPTGQVGIAIVNGRLQQSTHVGLVCLQPLSTLITVPASTVRHEAPTVVCDTNGTRFEWDRVTLTYHIADVRAFVEATRSVVYRSFAAAVVQEVEDPVRQFLYEHCSTLDPEMPLQLDIGAFAARVIRQTKERMAASGVVLESIVFPGRPSAPGSDVDENYEKLATASARTMAAAAVARAEHEEARHRLNRIREQLELNTTTYRAELELDMERHRAELELEAERNAQAYKAALSTVNRTVAEVQALTDILGVDGFLRLKTAEAIAAANGTWLIPHTLAAPWLSTPFGK